MSTVLLSHCCLLLVGVCDFAKYIHLVSLFCKGNFTRVYVTRKANSMCIEGVENLR